MLCSTSHKAAEPSREPVATRRPLRDHARQAIACVWGCPSRATTRVWKSHSTNEPSSQPAAPRQGGLRSVKDGHTRCSLRHTNREDMSLAVEASDRATAGATFEKRSVSRVSAVEGWL